MKKIVYDVARTILPPPLKKLIRRNIYGVTGIIDFHLMNRAINVYPPIEGMISYDEREYLYLLARGLEPGSNVVEIGCYAGLSTYFLTMGAKESGSHVHSIDPFDSDLRRQMEECDGSIYLTDGRSKPSLMGVMRTMERFDLQDTVTLIEGFSHDKVEEWNKLIRLLFIDGNHGYEDVLRDYEWSRFMPVGGIISFHDSNPPKYGYESVARVVREVIAPSIWEVIERVDSITTARRR